MHAPVAVAPNQLTAVVNGNDDGDKGEATAERIDYRAGDRQVDLAAHVDHTKQAAKGIEYAQRQQHKKGGAFEYKRHVKTRERPKLKAACARVGAGCS